jgi:Protein of unknown function (DUF1569)
MNSMFESGTLDEVLRRIDSLNAGSPHLWGKMGAAQMMAHTSASLEAATGKKTPRRLLIGRIIGPLFRKRFVDDSEFTRNSPTHPTFVIVDERVFAVEKERLLRLVREFSEGGEAKCTGEPHSFFGKLTPGEWGIGMYKHLDHHLRQFGA